MTHYLKANTLSWHEGFTYIRLLTNVNIQTKSKTSKTLLNGSKLWATMLPRYNWQLFYSWHVDRRSLLPVTEGLFSLAQVKAMNKFLTQVPFFDFDSFYLFVLLCSYRFQVKSITHEELKNFYKNFKSFVNKFEMVLHIMIKSINQFWDFGGLFAIFCTT